MVPRNRAADCPNARSGRRSIAIAVAATFALCGTPVVAQTTWTVDSCDEDNTGDPVAHTGTFRFAATNAASGDTVDLSGLSCSTITLTTGNIHIPVDDLTIN